MYVNYSGWNETHGSFYCNIFVDETRQDYAIEYGDGTIAKQMSPFRHVTADWNHDGDVYTQFGAWFKGLYGGNTFWTPEDLVRAAADALDKARHVYDNQVTAVHGIEIPLPEKRKSFDETVRDCESRAANREADRNRRMNALGIRPTNEPWAR